MKIKEGNFEVEVDGFSYEINYEEIKRNDYIGFTRINDDSGKRAIIVFKSGAYYKPKYLDTMFKVISTNNPKFKEIYNKYE